MFTAKENGDPKTAVKKISLKKCFTSRTKFLNIFFFLLQNSLKFTTKKKKLKKYFLNSKKSCETVIGRVCYTYRANCTVNMVFIYNKTQRYRGQAVFLKSINFYQCCHPNLYRKHIWSKWLIFTWASKNKTENPPLIQHINRNSHSCITYCISS